jgi:beta-D-galactosyl-(1->4)-L-rhamnose phosphorylase
LHKKPSHSSSIQSEASCRGKGIYLSQYRYFPENTFTLRSFIEQDLKAKPLYTTVNPYVDCVYFSKAKTLVLVYGSDKKQKVKVRTEEGAIEEILGAFEMKMHHLAK